MTSAVSGRRRRKAARPGEIIAAGLAAFAENGFAATKLEDVAKRAGVAKPTIYLYFASKEALFEAAIRDRVLTIMEGFEVDLDAFEGPTEVFLRELLHGLYERLVGTDAIEILRIVIGEGHRFPGLVSLYHDVALGRGIALVTRVLERGIARGEIRQAPASSDPRLIVAPAIMAGLWLSALASHVPLDRDAFRDAHLDLLLNGLFVRERPAPG